MTANVTFITDLLEEHRRVTAAGIKIGYGMLDWTPNRSTLISLTIDFFFTINQLTRPDEIFRMRILEAIRVLDGPSPPLYVENMLAKLGIGQLHAICLQSIISEFRLTEELMVPAIASLRKTLLDFTTAALAPRSETLSLVSAFFVAYNTNFLDFQLKAVRKASKEVNKNNKN